MSKRSRRQTRTRRFDLPWWRWPQRHNANAAVEKAEKSILRGETTTWWWPEPKPAPARPTRGLIQDPFDPSEAIMPSGQMGAKLFFAPVGTVAPTHGTLPDEWKQIGWVEPSELGFAPPHDTHVNDGGA